jgi:hypothetical protein
MGLIPSMLGDVDLKDLMITDPITVAPEDDIETAAQIIYKHKIGGLPVTKNGRLVGIITETDMLRAFIDMMGILSSTSRLDVAAGNKPESLKKPCISSPTTAGYYQCHHDLGEGAQARVPLPPGRLQDIADQESAGQGGFRRFSGDRLKVCHPPPLAAIPEKTYQPIYPKGPDGAVQRQGYIDPVPREPLRG